MQHTFADGPTSPIIAVDLVDEDGTHVGAGSLPVSVLAVDDVAPIIALSGAGSVDEGSVYTLNLGEVTDPGDDIVSQYVVNWGDGSSDTFTDAGDVGHVYDDGVSNPTITIDLVDEDGTHRAPVTLSVTVNNVAPTIALSGLAAVNEGAPYTLTLGAVTDPGVDTVTQYIVRWGDGNTDVFTSAGDVTHIYSDGLTDRTIIVDLVDEDGTHTGAGRLSLTANNVTPTIALSGAMTVDEGSVYRMTLGQVTDPGDDTVFLYITDWGDNSSDTFTSTGEVTHAYADGVTTPTIVVDLVDEDGTHENSGSLPVTVDNVTPTIALSGAASVDEGSPYTLTLGAVTDPGDDAVIEYMVRWGDGFSNTYTAAGDVTHTYDDGVAHPTIVVDLRDEDGTHIGAGSLSLTVEDVAPTIALAGAADVDEGSVYGLTLGAVTDPGDDTVTQYVVHWGDGETDFFVSGGVVTHTYSDGLTTPVITVDLVDEDATHLDAGSLSLTVNNVPPTIGLSGAAFADEGAPYSLTLGAVGDAGGDEVTDFVVHWGDGRTDSFDEPGPVTHTYAFDFVSSDTPTTIVVDLVDEDGTHADAGSLTITVRNVEPPPFVDSFAVLVPQNRNAGGLTLNPALDPIELLVVDDDNDDDDDDDDESLNKVYRYSPITGSLLGTLSLHTPNRSAKGITTDGTSFWVLDEDDKEVYRYSMAGVFLDSFSLTTPAAHLEGITLDGSTFWIVDKDEGMFHYSLSGTFLGESFALDSENSHAEGIATDGTNLWVADKDEDRVFRYSKSGTLLGSISVAPATHAEGVVTDGANIWVVDKDTDTVYRFDAS